MSETVRVRCVVTTAADGSVTVVGAAWNDTSADDDDLIGMADICRDDYVRHEFVTVDIPLPVEPVVVAEVEDGDAKA